MKHTLIRIVLFGLGAFFCKGFFELSTMETILAGAVTVWLFEPMYMEKPEAE